MRDVLVLLTYYVIHRQSGLATFKVLIISVGKLYFPFSNDDLDEKPQRNWL